MEILFAERVREGSGKPSARYERGLIQFFEMFRRASRRRDKAGLRPAKQHTLHRYYHCIQPLNVHPPHLLSITIICGTAPFVFFRFIHHPCPYRVIMNVVEFLPHKGKTKKNFCAIIRLPETKGSIFLFGGFLAC